MHLHNIHMPLDEMFGASKHDGFVWIRMQQRITSVRYVLPCCHYYYYYHGDFVLKMLVSKCIID